MADSTLKPWQRALAYTAFGVFALFVAFFVTFPYDALEDRIKLEADAAGYFVRIGSIGPGLFSVRASDIKVSKKVQPGPGDEKPPEPMTIDSISIGPTLLPPGVSVTVKLLGGSITTKVSGLSDLGIKVEVDKLDVSKGNLKGFTGIDMAGEINGEMTFKVPKASVGGEPAQPDFSQANGVFALETKNLTVNGGTMNLTLPMYGPEPTPLDLPKIAFGDLSAKMTFEKGAGKIDDFTGKSSDLELGATGTLKLSKKIDYSEPNVELRFKADPEFVKRLGLIGSALSMVGPDPKDPNFRMGHLTGYLGKPNFR
jgi:type II secretion system protein N